MTQPSFVPITEADQVRSARRLLVPGSWVPTRPAEIRVPVRRIGPGMGTPGPDQGYALRLARRFEQRLRLADGESAEDVTVGCALLASRRAALFGRAPTVHDVRVALTIWGFLGPASAELLDLRRGVFRSVAHEYAAQRALVDQVPEASLRLSPAEVEERAAADWRDLLDPAGSGAA
jgi:hypothetical protein